MATRKIDPALQALIDAGLISSGQADVAKTTAPKTSATARAGYSQAPRTVQPTRVTSGPTTGTGNTITSGAEDVVRPQASGPSATALAGYSQAPRSLSTPIQDLITGAGSGLEGMGNVQMELDKALAKMRADQAALQQQHQQEAASWSPNTGVSQPGIPNYSQQVQAQAPQMNYQQMAELGITDPKLMSGQQVADLFGVIFGKDAIKDILNQATNAKFDEWGKQTESLRDQSLTDYSAQYNQYLQNSRQNRQNAVRHGLQRGSSVAQEVLGQLGAQQGGAENQTMYQQQMADIAAQRGSQLAYDEFNALNMQNELATGLGNQAINQYGNEVQQQAAQLSHHGQLAQADAQVQAASISADAQMQSAAQAAAAQRHYANAVSQAQVKAAAMGASQQQAQQAGQNVAFDMLKEMNFSDEVATLMSLGFIDYNKGLEMENAKKNTGGSGSGGTTSGTGNYTDPSQKPEALGRWNWSSQQGRWIRVG